ncbi:6132_t:CDS:2, partial [Racocetra fulgida]
MPNKPLHYNHFAQPKYGCIYYQENVRRKLLNETLFFKVLISQIHISNTLRQHKKRENETLEQRELHRERDRENKKRKRQLKTDEQREAQEITEMISDNTESEMISVLIESDPRLDNILNVQHLSEADHKLLQKFRAEMNKLKHNLCPVCNERFPSINLVNGASRRCYNDKNELKKFSLENNMDPGKALKELKGLTDIEEMLIAQIFLVISVYYLRGSQYAYRSSFRDFNVRQSKVECALHWLKEYNCYYTDIDIDYDVLQSLPDDSPIDNQVLQLQEDDVDDETITRNFVPTPVPSH